MVWIYTLHSQIRTPYKSTKVRTFPHGLENNYAYKWTSDNFAGMLTHVVFLENCQKTICMHGTMTPECAYGFNEVPASDSTSEWAWNPNWKLK